MGYTSWTEALTPQLLVELAVDGSKLSLSLEMASKSHPQPLIGLCGVQLVNMDSKTQPPFARWDTSAGLSQLHNF